MDVPIEIYQLILIRSDFLTQIRIRCGIDEAGINGLNLEYISAWYNPKISKKLITKINGVPDLSS